MPADEQTQWARIAIYPRTGLVTMSGAKPNLLVYTDELHAKLMGTVRQKYPYLADGVDGYNGFELKADDVTDLDAALKSSGWAYKKSESDYRIPAATTHQVAIAIVSVLNTIKDRP